MMGVTKLQLQVLVAIETGLDENGVVPSYRELAETIGVKSVSEIHRIVLGLEARGRIRRAPHKARAIEIIGGVE